MLNRLPQGVIILSFIISISSNCNNRRPEQPTTDKESFILKGERHRLSGSLSPMNLQVIDSLLIIQNYGDSFWFHVYNKNTLSLIGKFGLEGRGPSEYLMPYMMNQKMKINDSSYLIIYDNSTKHIDFVNILKAVNNLNYYPKSIRLRDRKPFMISSISSAILIDDSLFIGTSADNSIRGRFFRYDFSNDILNWEPYYPIPDISPKGMFLDDLYKNCSALKPDGSCIAVASLFYKRIDILDKTGKLKRAVVFEQEKDPDFSNADSWPPKGAHEFFTSVSVSQDYIYALNIDLKVDSREIIDTVSLIKISWDENGPSETIKLTPKVGRIVVDETNKKIYGTTFLSEHIYIYKLDK